MRVAVLGGGPGAAAAALRLAQAGREVTLYHPARPGEKPCGGALPAYLLDELPEFDASDLLSVTVESALLENASGGRVALDLEGLRIYRRGDFDPALVAAARRCGARVREEKAGGLDWHSDRPIVTAGGEEDTYDWVIGGDGARGLSRRALWLEPQGESLGLGASLPGVRTETLVLSFPDVADAYLWVFPRPGGVSVGIAYSADLLSTGAAKASLDDFVRRHLDIGLGDVDGPRYRYPIPVYGPWSGRAVEAAMARRVLLVGDAAALADPLTREGIRYAVRSGIWAAEALSADAPERYPERLTDELEADLSRAERARDLFFEGPVGQWMVPFCRHHAGVRRVLADLLTCRQPYVGLRRQLLVSALTRRSGSPFAP